MNQEHFSEHAASAARGTAADPVENTGMASAVNDRVGVGSGDENVAKFQLATRWAEQFAPESGDTLEAALRRFKRVYQYGDAVSKLTEPDEA